MVIKFDFRKRYLIFFDFLNFLSYLRVINAVNDLLIGSRSLDFTLETTKLLKNLFISFKILKIF